MYPDFNKTFLYNYFKSRLIFRQILNCNFRRYGYCYSIDCCINIIYYFGMKLKTCFADMLMFIVAKIQKFDTLKISKFYKFHFLRF